MDGPDTTTMWRFHARTARVEGHSKLQRTSSNGKGLSKDGRCKMGPPLRRSLITLLSPIAVVEQRVQVQCADGSSGARGGRTAGGAASPYLHTCGHKTRGRKGREARPLRSWSVQRKAATSARQHTQGHSPQDTPVLSTFPNHAFECIRRGTLRRADGGDPFASQSSSNGCRNARIPGK